MDGTVVQTAAKTELRNWLKYPLPVMNGIGDFLDGAEDGGLEIAGIVSRRPDIAQRRNATLRSIREFGLRKLEEEVVLTGGLVGGERDKGRFVAEQSRKGKVAMIDDKPHRVVPAIFRGMIEIAEASAQGNHSSSFIYTCPPLHVVLGVVDHANTEEYLDRLVDDIELQGWLGRTVDDREISYSYATLVTLDVVKLQPYSNEAGLAFAETVSNAIPWPKYQL
jgi:hypothetical protein